MKTLRHSLIFILLLPTAILGQSLCPTGKYCGVNSPYCNSYTPPSTSGATAISSLPYNISTAGSYYLTGDLSSTGTGIYITYTGTGAIDINLNGHTLTYGTVANQPTTAITAYSVSGANATFTASNTLLAGEAVTLTGFGTSTFFNNETLTVLSTGLSSSQFEAAWSLGKVTTSGTAVTYYNGAQFNTSWVSPLVMTINGVAYTISSCSSHTSCTLTTSAGTQTAVAYSVGSGATESGTATLYISEHGILSCSTHQLQYLDPIFATNGLCSTSTTAPANLTVENGSIVQSTNATQYYSANNCPGSGVGAGLLGACADYPYYPRRSDVFRISNQASSGPITLRQLTMTWQQADSNGISIYYPGSAYANDIECNTFNNKVLLLNNRAYPETADINLQLNTGALTYLIQYNTMVGGPQTLIFASAPANIQYNDMNLGYYQIVPQAATSQGYSNDYAILNGPLSGTGSQVAYNYIHNSNGRGIGLLYALDLHGANVYGNYVSATELQANGEYGSNGSVNGGSWVGGCEIDGARGFEAKGTDGFNLYSNTFIIPIATGGCGGAGMAFTGFISGGGSAPPTPASASMSIHDNTEQVINNTGGSTILTPATCYLFDVSNGLFSNVFTVPSFVNDNCTTDGDFADSEAYGPGNNFSWASPTWARGSHPLTLCEIDGLLYCGGLIHWIGREASGVPDEKGYVFQDTTGSLTFLSDEYGATVRGATVQWTYTVTVKNSVGGLVSGALVSASDSGGQHTSCTTNGSGVCSLELRQETATAAAGLTTITYTSMNPNSITITAGGYTPLTYSKTMTATLAETQTLPTGTIPAVMMQ